MIALPAEVRFATAPRVLDGAVQAAGAALGPAGEASAARAAAGSSGGAAVDVDLAACEAFDSSLLAVLLELTRRAAAAGAVCRLHHVPPNLHKLAALYGVDELLFAAHRPLP